MNTEEMMDRGLKAEGQIVAKFPHLGKKGGSFFSFLLEPGSVVLDGKFELEELRTILKELDEVNALAPGSSDA